MQALILSGILNLLFLGLFFYFIVRKNPYPLAFDYRPRPEVPREVILPEKLLLGFLPLTLNQLQEQLSDESPVQEGYRVCDFALALLAYRDHVDIERALGRKDLSQRIWKVGTKHTLILYPGFKKEDFSKIQAYLQIEKWPQTSYGLHCLLKKQGLSADPTLLQAFCMTEEFHALEMLFGRSGVPIKKGTLLTLAAEAKWELLSSHLSMQKEGSDFSDTKRMQFLQKCVEGGSKTAAYLFLLTDYKALVKTAEDATVLNILGLLTTKTSESVAFAQAMKESIRSDAVKQKAAEKLVQFGITDEVAARLYPRPALGELRPKFREPPPASPPPSLHIIQPGESLWLIARKYHVPIELLIKFNNLSSTTIRPGKTLKIPPI